MKFELLVYPYKAKTIGRSKIEGENIGNYSTNYFLSPVAIMGFPFVLYIGFGNLGFITKI